MARTFIEVKNTDTLPPKIIPKKLTVLKRVITIMASSFTPISWRGINITYTGE